MITEDVTGRKRADEALRLSERNLAASQEIAAIGSYTWDLETNRMLWSDELYRILGLAPGEVPPAFDTYTAFIFPDDREETIRKSRRMNETGETRPNEHRIVRADGTVRTVQVNSRVFSAMDGRPRVLHGVVQDITERKRAEAEVLESEARLRSVLDSSLDALYRLNLATGRYEYVSPAFERVVGRSAEEMLSTASDEAISWVHPDDLPAAMAGLARLDETGTAEIDYRLLGADGEYRWLSNHLRLIRDDAGRPLYRDGTVRDITDEHRITEALRESEERFRLLFENSQEALFVYEPVADEDGRVIDVRYVDVNPAAERFVRRTRAELIGRTSAEVLGGSPTTSSIDALARVARTGEPVHYIEKSLRLGRWYETFMYAHQPGQVAMLLLDITERKRAEEALRETRDYLDNLINYANAPIIVWNPDFRITRFNAAFEHLSGYAADEVIGRELVVLFPEESRDESLRKIQRTITEQWQSVEIPILRPDGGIRIALWNSANIYDTEGTTLLATIAQGQDITERKEAEAALRESEQRFRLALRNAPVTVAMMDRDLRYVWAYNQKTAPQDGIVGRTDADIFTSGEAAHLTEIKRRVLEEDVEVREQMWLDRPGGPIYLDVYFEPFHDETGSVTGVGIATVDLTRRRLAEERAARLVEQHRLALDAARMGWWHYDPATRIASYDDRYREIFEVTGESRPNDEILKRLHPDDLPGVWERVEAALDPVDPKPVLGRVPHRDARRGREVGRGPRPRDLRGNGREPPGDEPRRDRRRDHGPQADRGRVAGERGAVPEPQRDLSDRV